MPHSPPRHQWGGVARRLAIRPWLPNLRLFSLVQCPKTDVRILGLQPHRVELGRFLLPLQLADEAVSVVRQQAPREWEVALEAVGT